MSGLIGYALGGMGKQLGDWVQTEHDTQVRSLLMQQQAEIAAARMDALNAAADRRQKAGFEHEDTSQAALFKHQDSSDLAKAQRDDARQTNTNQFQLDLHKQANEQANTRLDKQLASEEKTRGAALANARFIANANRPMAQTADGTYFVAGVDEKGNRVVNYLQAADGKPMVGPKNVSDDVRLFAQAQFKLAGELSTQAANPNTDPQAAADLTKKSAGALRLATESLQTGKIPTRGSGIVDPFAVNPYPDGTELKKDGEIYVVKHGEPVLKSSIGKPANRQPAAPIRGTSGSHSESAPPVNTDQARISELQDNLDSYKYTTLEQVASAKNELAALIAKRNQRLGIVSSAMSRYDQNMPMVGLPGGQ